MKGLQNRLDLILGRQGSKAKDVYESKTSLASRIVNVERVVDSIEERLSHFMEMYQEDRKRFLEPQQCGEKTANNSCWIDGVRENQILPINDNEPNLETSDNDNEESPEVSPDDVQQCVTTSPSHSSTFTSISQGLELFSIVSEQNNSNFRSVNAYNV